jgi:hypothetical protein
VTGIPLTAFAVGVSAPRTILTSSPDPLAVLAWLCLCTVLIALMTEYFRQLRDNTAANRCRLVLEAYGQVDSLLSRGFDMLAPTDHDPDSMRILLHRSEEGAMVICKETWQGAEHEYVIWPNGLVQRKIRGSRLSRADRRWLRQPLSAALLRYLVEALQAKYEPRKRLVRA